MVTLVQTSSLGDTCGARAAALHADKRTVVDQALSAVPRISLAWRSVDCVLQML